MDAQSHRRYSAAFLAFGLLLSAQPAAADSFTGLMSGTWWNAQRDGEGQFISFERSGSRDMAILAYFTYDDAGRAVWKMGAAQFEPGANRIDIDLIQGSGPVFGLGFRAEEVELLAAGAVTLRYIDCGRIGFAYTGRGEVLDFEITRLPGSAHVQSCTRAEAPGSQSALTERHTGVWWDPERSGEGQFISVENLDGQDFLLFFYFTYDDSGQPTWKMGSTRLDAGRPGAEVALVSGSGARFGSAFNPGDVQLAPAGSVSLRATGCGALRMRYNGSLNFGLNLQRAAGQLMDAPCWLPEPTPAAIDADLRALIAELGLSGDPSRGRQLPGIDAPLARLGKLLFFSKTLSADLDTACASCHHPTLAGVDGLVSSVGAGALEPALVGPGRRIPDGSVLMHRNTNTFFNTGLLDRGLFWDSRVESLAQPPFPNGEGDAIRTPDSPFGMPDPRSGPNLLAAQARFPVVEPAEMRGAGYPSLSDEDLRRHLAARIGDYDTGAGTLPPSVWLAEFQAAFASDAGAEALINFDNISLALAEYQRSAILVESPWSQYVRGDYDAISSQAKAGALLFFRPTGQGGLHCVRCHSGDLFTDERHHALGFPQIGPGFGDGDGDNNRDDFGRQRETGQSADRHAFRTPSLLNVELTAPYGHAGFYQDLPTVVSHYFDTRVPALGQLHLRPWCLMPPFDTQPGCGQDLAMVRANTNAALDSLAAARLANPDSAMPQIRLRPFQPGEVNQVVSFLKTLTDPCLHERACFGRWIPAPEEAPDGFQLNAVDRDGNPL